MSPASRISSLFFAALLLGACANGESPADSGRHDGGSGTNCALTLCGNVCSNLMTDPLNCGACGRVCSGVPNAVTTCISGVCSDRCFTGFTDCDPAVPGCETDLRSENACGHCVGQCGTGNLCNAADPTTASCTIMCPATTTRCANECVSLQTDIANCGGCGIVCPGGTQQDPLCVTGHCALGCSFGRGDCDHMPANGCETDTMSDTDNCGACGHPCGNAQCCNVGTCGMCNVVGTNDRAPTTPPAC